MSYIDIAILAIVVICALIGLWRGFFKSLISFFGLFVSFLVAFFVTKPVVSALLDVQAFKNFVVGSGEGWSLYGWIINLLPDLDGGGVLATLLSPLKAIAEAQGVDPAGGVALLLANGIFSILVCIALFIIIRFILLLFTMFANAMTKGKLMGAINRLLGLVMGIIKGAWYTCMLMVILSFTLGLSLMAPVRDQMDKSVLAKPVYNVVVGFTDKYFTGSGDTLVKLRDIFEKAYGTGDGDEDSGIYAGTYNEEEESEIPVKIVLYADNTFDEMSGESVRRGTYSVEGTVLTLTFSEEESHTAEIADGVITLDGRRYIKNQ